LDQSGGETDVFRNAVDGDAVPVPHFGVILSMKDWKTLSVRLQATDTEFIIEPRIRFEGQKGEQATMFLTDPAGNALEFKAFASDSQIFEK
jgi:extradiol dioxygenase family protein